MKKNIILSIFIGIWFTTTNCSRNELFNEMETKIVSFDQQTRMVVTPTQFLKTKEKMCDLAINPCEDENGSFKDKLYNIKIYIEALKRMSKYTFIKEDQIVCDALSAKDLKMTDDLFEYIKNLYEDQNIKLKMEYIN